MDPYLEQPGLWTSFHSRLIARIAESLNERLPEGYAADVEVRYEVSISPPAASVSPGFAADASVTQQRPEAATAVADQLAIDVGIRTELTPLQTRVWFANVSDVSDGRAVTTIELLSPANKRASRDRDAFLKKKAFLLASDVSYVESDLLVSGLRAVECDDADAVDATNATTPYVVAVYPGWERDPVPNATCYPRRLDEPLPAIGVPVAPAIPPVALSLQNATTATYDTDRSRSRIDYSQPPPGKLSPAFVEQARQFVLAFGESTDSDRVGRLISLDVRRRHHVDRWRSLPNALGCNRR